MATIAKWRKDWAMKCAGCAELSTAAKNCECKAYNGCDPHVLIVGHCFVKDKSSDKWYCQRCIRKDGLGNKLTNAADVDEILAYPRQSRSKARHANTKAWLQSILCSACVAHCADTQKEMRKLEPLKVALARAAKGGDDELDEDEDLDDGKLDDGKKDDEDLDDGKKGDGTKADKDLDAGKKDDEDLDAGKKDDGSLETSFELIFRMQKDIHDIKRRQARGYRGDTWTSRDFYEESAASGINGPDNRQALQQVPMVEGRVVAVAPPGLARDSGAAGDNRYQ